MWMKKCANIYMELRKIVLVEPADKEFVQLSYLCKTNSDISDEALMQVCGGTLKGLGTATDRMLGKLGIYPVSIYYERNGVTIREKENDTDGFKQTEDNRYLVDQTGMEKLKKLRKRRQAA